MRTRREGSGGDEVHRAKAIVNTVWLALINSELDGEDLPDLADTLLCAVRELEAAEQEIGLYVSAQS